MDNRLTRRMAGVLCVRLPELGLDKVHEPRRARGKRWNLPTLLRSIVVSIVAGCKSFAQAEHLTAEMSRPMARILGIRRRVPDTTSRDLMVKLDPNQLRACLHEQTYAAHRRKSLAPFGLPFGVVAIDGKYTTIRDWNDERKKTKGWDSWNEKYALFQQHTESGKTSRRVGTMSCSLVSARAKVCIDAVPIPKKTNEMGHFPVVVAGLMSAYKKLGLFELVSCDSGMCSEANARLLACRYKLHYLFGLKGNQLTLQMEARRLLLKRRAQEAEAETVDVVGRYTVTRRLYTSTKMAGYLEWTHLETALRVESVKAEIETGKVVEYENRYFISSLPGEDLKSGQWLYLVRSHWAVENNCHNTWDTVFMEDEKPWVVSHPKAMVNVLLLRRLAYNMAALFRSVTQRGEENRLTPWRDILRWFYNTLIGADDEDLRGIRARKVVLTVA